jgi:DNA-binding GntR family transcriptional regulator
LECGIRSSKKGKNLSREETYQLRKNLRETLLKAKIYQILKKDIINGRFKPNQQLSSAKLAMQLGVSKSPVNQAIHRLELEGLVYLKSNQRYCVHSYSKKNIQEMGTIRLLLESYAGRLATKTISRQKIEHLERINLKIFDQLDHFKEAKNAQKFIEGFIALNKKFHDLITISCGNERLIKWIQDSRERLVVFNLIRYLTLEDLRISFNDHTQLIKYIKVKDEDRVEKILREHINRSTQTILNRAYGEDSSAPLHPEGIFGVGPGLQIGSLDSAPADDHRNQIIRNV